jgi:hypothetical protein
MTDLIRGAVEEVPEHSTAPRAADGARRRHHLVRWIAAAVFIGLAVPPAMSYYDAVSAPGTDRFLARTVNWMRDNGMSSAVDTVERWWFTSHGAPKIGGTPENGLPTVAAPSGNAQGRRIDAKALAAAKLPPRLPVPANMQPLVANPLTDEGVWKPTGREVSGVPAIYTSFFRPDAIHTSLIAGAMWMDTTLLKSVYVPGLREPPGAPQVWGTQIPVSVRCQLVAAFNSGFKQDAALGGVYTDGVAVHPLVNGQASFVVDKFGKPSVGMWGRDFQMSPDIATVRQNLALIVDNGQPAAGLPENTDGAWGATVGNRTFVWRSGVGIDKSGGLVYVAGPGLSAVTLAILLQRAGAVRAMQMDINADWTTAYYYDAPDPNNCAGVQGTKLLPDMSRPGDRYLQAGERDFHVMLANT